MKNIISIFMVFALSLSFITCLAGCGNGESSVQSVALVTSIRENFTYLSFDKNSEAYEKNQIVSEKIYDSISEALYSYGSVTGITTEGVPTVCGEAFFEKPDALIDSSKRRKLSNKEANGFFEDFEQNCVATTNETDTLQAITRAADAVNGSNATDKTIFVVDSGLSTSGYVNFIKNNLFDTDPSLFVEKLTEKHAIPDLSGIKLIWYGLADVCGEQTTLSAEQAFKLKEIWSAILSESSVENVEFNSTPLKAVKYNGQLPNVSEVPVPVSDIDLGIGNGYMTIDIESLGFKPDTAQILDRTAAEQCLSDVIACLENNPSLDIVIAGSCATVGSGGKTLSRKRADAVKKILCDQGIDESRISTIGLGSMECSLRVDDLNPDGTLNETLAKQNRAVFIYSADSLIAEEINKLI